MINLSLVNKYWSKKIDCLSKFFSMEKIYLGVLLLIINYSLSATTYYVSPNGSDNTAVPAVNLLQHGKRELM
jgi:hypothetical protein